MTKISTLRVGNRVEVRIDGSEQMRTNEGIVPDAQILAYDDPAEALDDARGFLADALAAQGAAALFRLGVPTFDELAALVLRGRETSFSTSSPVEFRLADGRLCTLTFGRTSPIPVPVDKKISD